MTYLHSKPPIYMFIFSFYIAQTGIIVFLFFKHLLNSIYFIHFFPFTLPAFLRYNSTPKKELFYAV